MKKLFCTILIITSTVITLQAQGLGDPTLRRIGYHTGNRAGISFYNDGQIAGFNIGVDIRGEWPLGSGENYIGDLIPLIGVEFITTQGDTLHSVTISRGPRTGQGRERHPQFGYFWGFNPIPGYLNPNGESVAMSHLKDSWPIGGWADDPRTPADESQWVDRNGNTEWNGYFGRSIMNADQESFFVADDQDDDEFNANFMPDSTDPLRKGMALRLYQRGFQWSSFLAEDVIFWLYDIENEGTTTYRKANFGTVVGTLAGGDGDSGDDLGFFDAQDWITYSWDSDNVGNKGQKVGYVGYAFLESPGNPFDGIDNDGDAITSNVSAPVFSRDDFDEVIYDTGDQVVLIDPVTYERTFHTVGSITETVTSMGVEFTIEPGVTVFQEGHIGRIVQGVAVPDESAYDGIDNDLDGLIDENRSIHVDAREVNNQSPLSYINYVTGEGVGNLMIDEKRDNNIDEDGDWMVEFDDVGSDGLGPADNGYVGPDTDGTEGNGKPDQGEPNFGKTDPDESDQIGLTAFNFFANNASPDMSSDSTLWSRMVPGRFDVIPAQPQDGDFIYASGFFPLPAKGTERFSVALLFGEDRNDIFNNKKIVQQIYNSGYKFPQPPPKPKVSVTHNDGKVTLYWDGELTENSRDFITKKNDFQGYKIYRATDAGFIDAREITNAIGVLSFDKPIAQFDKDDDVAGFFYPSGALLEQVGGTTFYLGSNTGVDNKFVDSTVVPGVTYYYAVVAYDSGDDSLDIFPSENSKFMFRSNTGEVLTDDNTVYITPGKRPVGFQGAEFENLVKSPTYRATGVIDLEVVDEVEIKNGFSYKIAFQDSSLQGYTKSYSLIDLVTPDTVIIPSTNNQYIVDPGQIVNLPANTDSIYVNGEVVYTSGPAYTAGYDTLINKSTIFYGRTKIVDGFRLQIYNDELIKRDTGKSGWVDIQSSPPPSYTFQPFFLSNTPPGSNYNGIDMPYDYEIEFYETIADTSSEDTLFAPAPTIIPAREVTFKVKNLTTNKYIDFVYLKTGTVSTVHSIYFKENVDGLETRTWRVNITYLGADVPLEPTGSLQIFTTKPFSRYDEVEFSMKAAEISNDLTEGDLDRIKVVPNPYVVTHAGEARLLSSQTSGRGEREIRFTYVPPGAKISIFTVRGELIKTLRHEELYVGDVYWNLRSDENIDVAYGVYVFVVEVPKVGTKIGKFALIK